MSGQTIKRKFGMAFVLSIIASIIIMVSPSLVWFREEVQVFGQSFGGLAVKGTELGDLAELARWAGVSIFARGEYAVILGAFALALTLVCFFVPSKRKLMASLIGIIAILCLGVGVEPTLRLVGEGTMPGEGVYLLFVGSVVLLIGAIRLPSAMRVETYPQETPPSETQAYQATERRMPPEASRPEPVARPPRSDTAVSSEPPSIAPRPSGTIPRPVSRTDDIVTDRNRLIAVGIGLIILAIFSSVAFRLPEAYTSIVGGLFVGSLIKIVIAAIMLVMLLSVRGQILRVIGYYVHRLFRLEQYPSRAKASDNINGLSAELSNVVIIAIAWPLVAQIVRWLLMIDIERDFGWISILVMLGFVALLLYRLYRGYGLLMPVLAAMGKAPQEVSCPECSTMNSVSAKFCLSCGAELQPKPAEKIQPVSLHCSKCGAENSPGAKFCQNCGAPL